MKKFRYLPDKEIVLEFDQLRYFDSLENFNSDCVALGLPQVSFPREVRNVEVTLGALSYVVFYESGQRDISEIETTPEFFEQFINQIEPFIKLKDIRDIEINVSTKRGPQ